MNIFGSVALGVLIWLAIKEFSRLKRRLEALEALMRMRRIVEHD